MAMTFEAARRPWDAQRPDAIRPLVDESSPGAADRTRRFFRRRGTVR